MKTLMKIQRDDGIESVDLQTIMGLLGRGTGSTRVKLFVNGDYREVKGALLVQQSEYSEPVIVIHAESEPDKMPDLQHGVKMARNLREEKRLRLHGKEIAVEPSVPGVELDILQADHTASEQVEPA